MLLYFMTNIANFIFFVKERISGHRTLMNNFQATSFKLNRLYNRERKEISKCLP